MRYENQNPQYIYLLEKIEEQEKIIEHLKEFCKRSNDALNVVVDRLDMRCVQLRDFNRLPWYRKCFYKFKV